MLLHRRLATGIALADNAHAHDGAGRACSLCGQADTTEASTFLAPLCAAQLIVNETASDRREAFRLLRAR